MYQVTLEEAQQQLPQLIQQALAGEEIVIALPEQKNVHLVVPDKPYRLLGTAAGQVYIAEDFDAPLEDFKEYL